MQDFIWVATYADDTKLKEIVNKKLYKIIELMEFNVNYSK